MSALDGIIEQVQGVGNPSRKKPMFPVIAPLRSYLKVHGREVKFPVSYKDLLQYTYSVPIKDKNGRDTLWEKTIYDKKEWDYICEGLVHIYALLKTEGDLSFTKHLDVARIDYCTFGNSHPFRIRIVNKYNDNYDHYYIKIADASRIYGLELEHLLSPNRITFFTSGDTLVEEHIPGIPGDVFIQQMMNAPETNKIRLAKEFVKFNERCFVRLLGDMRSYNFVVDITPDIEDYQYRIRCIDFDQQSYEGRKNLYLPQFFKENNLKEWKKILGLIMEHSLEIGSMVNENEMYNGIRIYRFLVRLTEATFLIYHYKVKGSSIHTICDRRS